MNQGCAGVSTADSTDDDDKENIQYSGGLEQRSGRLWRLSTTINCVLNLLALFYNTLFVFGTETTSVWRRVFVIDCFPDI